MSDHTTDETTADPVPGQLAQAHAFVEHASIAADLGDRVVDAALGLRCFAVAGLLVDAGAVPDADLLADTIAGTPRQLLTAAADALDQIPVDARPAGLLSARAALAAALLMAAAADDPAAG